MMIELSKEEAVALLRCRGEYAFVTRCCGGDPESKEFSLVGDVAARVRLALARQVESEGASYLYGLSLGGDADWAGWNAASDRILLNYAYGRDTRKEVA